MKIVAMLLAGGQGSRLSILSQRRAKPAVPFGGNYRIIDFTLSNIAHSGIPYVGILTQYKPYSLMDHIGNGEWWGFNGRDRMARVLPPYTGEVDSDWYAGTADAVWQNRNFIARFDPELVVILSGDHIYRMDYSEMIRLHRDSGADATLALQPVPWEDTPRFGVVKIDEVGKVREFQEKPKKDPISNLASLGIYIFTPDTLLRRLEEDAANPDSDHDFGKNVLPGMLGRDRMYGYVFEDYWRDVGTIQSYWDAHMELLMENAAFDMKAWNIQTNYFGPRIGNDLPAQIASGARVKKSYISRGCVIEGDVENSVLFPGVRVHAGAVVRDSILMSNGVIGANCRLDCVIADKNVFIDHGSVVGTGENIVNEQFPSLLDSGISVIGKNAILPPGTEVGRNVLIPAGATARDLPGSQIPSGTTVAEPEERKLSPA